MAFIRIKKIGKRDGKKYSYAYLVQNKWRKKGAKGSRQDSTKYLGAVLCFPKNMEKGFTEFYGINDINEYLSKSTKQKIIEDLVHHELAARGFVLDAKKRLQKDGLLFRLSERRFVNEDGSEKGIVIEMNEGFLCKHTLDMLLKIKPADDEHETGIILAKAFLEAGLNVPKEIFVGFFLKV